jgi:DNA repair protein RecO (recombination protein O)
VSATERHGEARLEQTAAILLRKTKFSETSLIVTWLSQNAGKLKTIAKGARRPRSRFGGTLDLFHQCEIQFARSRKGELHALRETVLLEAYEAIRFDFQRLALASYFAELVDQVTELDHPAPDLFDLLQRGLGHLAAHPASRLPHARRKLVEGLG